MKRTLSLVLAVLMVLALFGAAAEDTKKVEIRVNMQAGTGVAEAWAAVEAGYEALHPEVDIIIDLKPDEGYADWVKAQFSSENPEADLVAINLAGPAASGKSLNFFEYAYNESPYTGKEWKDQVNFGAQVRDMAKGEWTSISLQSVQVLWFYNAKIFEEVGVTRAQDVGRADRRLREDSGCRLSAAGRAGRLPVLLGHAARLDRAGLCRPDHPRAD